MTLLVPSPSSSPVWSPERSAERLPEPLETKLPLAALSDADELAELLALEGGVALGGVLDGGVLDGGVGLVPDPLDGPAVGWLGDLASPLPVLPPLDPDGFLGMVPVADCLAEPAEIGGELALIRMEEGTPKQTLSLGLGGTAPSFTAVLLDVASSLDTGKKTSDRGSGGVKLFESSPEVAKVRSLKLLVTEGEE